MTDNTVKTQSGIEIYTHNIFLYADEYLEKEHKKDEDKVADYFVDMIFNISDRIEKPSNDDIELLDNIFDVFVRLCAKYNVLPTLEVFGFLVKINNATFSDWASGKYRSSSLHGQTVKKWKETCKAMVVHRLHNQYGANANLIFTAKAAYGMVEAAPMPTENPSQIQGRTAEQIREQYGAQLECMGEMPEFPE